MSAETYQPLVTGMVNIAPEGVRERLNDLIQRARAANIPWTRIFAAIATAAAGGFSPAALAAAAAILFGVTAATGDGFPIPTIDFETIKEILTLLAPAIDELVAQTATPLDNIAWKIIQRLVLSQRTALEIYDRLAAQGRVLMPLSDELRAAAMAEPISA